MMKIQKQKLFTMTCLMIIFASVVVIVMAMVNHASAANVSSIISWTPAGNYEDGSTMPESEIDHFEIHYTANQPFKEQKEPLIVSHEKREAQIALDIKPSTDPVVLRIAMRTRSIYGNLSEFSNVIEDEFVVSNAMKPGAPAIIGLKLVCVDSKCEILLTSVEEGE